MTSIQIPDELEEALEHFVAESGMSRERVISNALREFLDDRYDAEDIKDVQAALAEEGRTYTSAELRQELGLED